MHRPELSLLTTVALLLASTGGFARAAEVRDQEEQSMGSPGGDRDNRAAPRAPRPLSEQDVAAESQSRRWYGYQPLAADTTALAVALWMPGVSRGAAFTTGVALWGLGGPIVHAVHRRPGAALVSLAMRAAFPLLGWYASGGGRGCQTTCKTAVGSCADDPSNNYWHVTSTTCGGSAAAVELGALVASALDSAVVGWETASPGQAKAESAARSQGGLTLDSAGLSPTQSGAALSLGGHF
jgi:hypothetical protein